MIFKRFRLEYVRNDRVLSLIYSAADIFCLACSAGQPAEHRSGGNGLRTPHRPRLPPAESPTWCEIGVEGWVVPPGRRGPRSARPSLLRCEITRGVP